MVRRVASEVRAGCERIAPTLGFVDTDGLALFCPFASSAVTSALVEAGIHAEQVAGYFQHVGHFWTEVQVAGHGTLTVDITARQFAPRLAKVLVLSRDDPRHTRYYARTTPASDVLHYDETADLLRLLPQRWWTLDAHAPELLDARVVTVLREETEVAAQGTAAIAAKVQARPDEVLQSMCRLAARSPVYELRRVA